MLSKKNKTLSEQVAESFIPQQIRDIENDSEDDTAPKIADFDEDNADSDTNEQMSLGRRNLSGIRKRNVKMLSDHSDKYKGKLSSRNEFEEEDFEDECDDSDNDKGEEDVLEQYRKQLKNCQISDVNEKSTDEEEEDSGNEEDDFEEQEDESGESDSDYDSNNGEEELEREEQNIISTNNKEREIEKGMAVQSQLKIWEKLLEVRIHSQKLLTKANSLPLPDQFQEISKNHDSFIKLTKETSSNIENLLEKLLDVQHFLGDQCSETKTLFKASSRKRSATDEGSFNGPSSKRFASILEENFQEFRPYRNSVLAKWDDRTKLLTPGAGSKKKSLMDEYDVIKRIENILLNKHELIEKSRKVKGTYKLFGQKDAIEEDVVDVDEGDKNDRESSDNKKDKDSSSVDIYDDTDFYHQQLRELIEFKSNTSANSAEITKQFAELQKIRQKMKKKVDTRASKGRKIRYVVHKKLVNFMAPQDSSQWTDDSKNELYRSLFAT